MLTEFECNPERNQPENIKANVGNITDHFEDWELSKYPIYPAPFFLERERNDVFYNLAHELCREMTRVGGKRKNLAPLPKRLPFRVPG